MKLDIVYEDEYMIACVKPYGVPSQPDKTFGTDMVTLVKEHIYEQSGDDGEPYVAIINRLDRPVGGIILFAKDETTAARLTDMLQDGEIQKYYQVVVEGSPEDSEGEYIDYLLHDKKQNITKVVKKDTKGAKRAELYYELLDELETDEGVYSLLLIELITGRHHQIRAQMASHGTPVWGDTKYGSHKGNEKMKKGGKKSGGKTEIGLFSTRIEFVHPITGKDILLHREPEGQAFEMIDQMDW